MNTYMKNIAFTLMVLMSISATMYGAEVERKETLAQLRQKHAQELNFIRSLHGGMIKPEDVEKVEAMVKTKSEIAANIKLDLAQLEAKSELHNILRYDDLSKKAVQEKAQKILDQGLLNQSDLDSMLREFYQLRSVKAIKFLLKNGANPNDKE